MQTQNSSSPSSTIQPSQFVSSSNNNNSTANSTASSASSTSSSSGLSNIGQLVSTQNHFTQAKPHIIDEMEIFLFSEPDSKKTIMLSEVSVFVTTKEIEKEFSRFGLVYDVRSVVNRFAPSTTTTLIRFYLESSMKKAHNHHMFVEKIKLRGVDCILSPSVFKSSGRVKNMQHNKTLNILNYLLGFDQYSSEISGIEHESTELVEIQLDQPQQLDDTDDGTGYTNGGGQVRSIYQSRWHAQVIYTFKQIDCSIRVNGIGFAEDPDRLEVIKVAKKFAVVDARRETFKKVAILVYPNLHKSTSIPFILDESAIVLPQPETNEEYDFMINGDQILQQIEQEEQEQIDQNEIMDEDFDINDQEFNINNDNNDNTDNNNTTSTTTTISISSNIDEDFEIDISFEQ